MEFSSFHCSSEWHFSRLKGQGAHYAPLIYSLALRLTKKSNVFSASIPTLAAYFGADEKTIRKAIRLLLDKGFFELISEESGASVRYRPLRHPDWAAKHGGQCTEKCSYPWEGEPGADTLGPELYAISGQRFRPYPNFIKGMRKTGHSEEAIREHFRDFIAERKPVGSRAWNIGLAGDFIKHLRNQPISSNTPSQLLVGVPLPTFGTSQVPSVGR